MLLVYQHSASYNTTSVQGFIVCVQEIRQHYVIEGVYNVSISKTHKIFSLKPCPYFNRLVFVSVNVSGYCITDFQMQPFLISGITRCDKITILKARGPEHLDQGCKTEARPP